MRFLALILCALALACSSDKQAALDAHAAYTAAVEACKRLAPDAPAAEKSTCAVIDGLCADGGAGGE